MLTKHKNFVSAAITTLLLLFVAFVPVQAVYSQAYGEGSYGECGYDEGCDAEQDEDLSDTGDARDVLIYAGLILLGGAVVVYTIRHRKRNPPKK